MLELTNISHFKIKHKEGKWPFRADEPFFYKREGLSRNVAVHIYIRWLSKYFISYFQVEITHKNRMYVSEVKELFVTKLHCTNRNHIILKAHFMILAWCWNIQNSCSQIKWVVCQAQSNFGFVVLFGKAIRELCFAENPIKIGLMVKDKHVGIFVQLKVIKLQKRISYNVSV